MCTWHLTRTSTVTVVAVAQWIETNAVLTRRSFFSLAVVWNSKTRTFYSRAVNRWREGRDKTVDYAFIMCCRAKKKKKKKGNNRRSNVIKTHCTRARASPIFRRRTGTENRLQNISLSPAGPWSMTLLLFICSFPVLNTPIRTVRKRARRKPRPIRRGDGEFINIASTTNPRISHTRRSSLYWRDDGRKIPWFWFSARSINNFYSTSLGRPWKKACADTWKKTDRITDPVPPLHRTVDIVFIFNCLNMFVY